MNTVTPEQLGHFKEAFTSGTSGIRRHCKCGREFYDAVESSGWEPGELEQLRADPDAIALGHPVSTLILNNAVCVMACDCWHQLAANTIAWLTQYRRPVGIFFKLEADALQERAKTYPSV